MNHFLGAIQSSSQPVVAYPVVTPGVARQYDSLPGLPARQSWGTVKRNSAYVGPALRVEDNSNPGTTVDINFDANGFVTAALPYGSDTRVIKLYGQFGTGDDLSCAIGDNIQIIGSGGDYGTWELDLQGTGYLTSDLTVADVPAWAVSSAVWSCGIRRKTGTSNLRPVWAVEKSSNYMSIGLWQEGLDLHWRVNGSSPVDWSGTDWTLDSTAVQNTLSRLIGDCSNGSPALAIFQNVDRGTRTFTAPITYDSGANLFIGGGIISNPFIGGFFELTIFEPSAALTPAARVYLDAGMQEPVRSFDGIEVAEQRVMAIVGPTVDEISSYQHRLYGVMGANTDQISAHQQRVYVIVEE